MVVDNITIDGTEIDLSSGDLTVDVAGDIILDADGGDFKFQDGGTEILRVSNSSSDVVIKPIVDAKDIIFQQRDGTEVARIEDNGTFNVVTSTLAINGTAVTSTAAELNLLDGATSVGGRAVLLSTTTLSSTTEVIFNNSLITSSYNNYLFTLEDVQTGSGNVNVIFLASVDNGSSYYNSAGNYRKISFNGIENESNNQFTSRYGTNEDDMRITGNYQNSGNDAALKIDAQVLCMSLNGTAYKKFHVDSHFSDASDPPKLVYENAIHLFDGSQSAVNNLKIKVSNGNFASGKIKLFGLN